MHDGPEIIPEKQNKLTDAKKQNKLTDVKLDA